MNCTWNREGYDVHVADCIRCYTRDWLHVSRQYLGYSSSVGGKSGQINERLQHLGSLPPPEFEVDLDEQLQDECEKASFVIKS